MRSNFHIIGASLKYTHKFKEYLYGVSEYIQSLFKSNIIKISNSIVTKLYLKSRLDENVIKIRNDSIRTILMSILKINQDDCNIKIKNDVDTELHIPVKVRKNVVSIYNSFIIYISKKINIENVVKIYNSASAILKMITKADNDIVVDSDDVTTKVNINPNMDVNDFKFNDDEVNAAAWYFTKIEAMGGSINDYYNKTIEATGRTKVV